MKITKAKQKKLSIYYDYLMAYLRDFEDKNGYFYQKDRYNSQRILELINDITPEHATKILNEVYDKEDQEMIKNCLNVKEIYFKASPEKPIHAYTF